MTPILFAPQCSPFTIPYPPLTINTNHNTTAQTTQLVLHWNALYVLYLYNLMTKLPNCKHKRYLASDIVLPFYHFPTEHNPMVIVWLNDLAVVDNDNDDVEHNIDEAQGKVIWRWVDLPELHFIIPPPWPSAAPPSPPWSSSPTPPWSSTAGHLKVEVDLPERHFVIPPRSSSSSSFCLL